MSFIKQQILKQLFLVQKIGSTLFIKSIKRGVATPLWLD